MTLWLVQYDGKSWNAKRHLVLTPRILELRYSGMPTLQVNLCSILLITICTTKLRRMKSKVPWRQTFAHFSNIKKNLQSVQKSNFFYLNAVWLLSVFFILFSVSAAPNHFLLLWARCGNLWPRVNPTQMSLSYQHQCKSPVLDYLFSFIGPLV